MLGTQGGGARHPEAQDLKTFKLAAAEEPADPEERRWRKDAPPSRVLFATNGRGAVYIIEHVGSCASYLVSESGWFVGSELRPWQFPGIWVWEGTIRVYRSYEGEYDEEADGDIRPLDESEASALEANQDVWDRSLWENQ